MGRSAKPARAKVDTKLRGARTSAKTEDSRVSDLEKRLAEALKGEAAALEQQAATAEILRVISSSPTDVQPVFEAIVQSAARLCDSPRSNAMFVDGDRLQLVARCVDGAIRDTRDLRDPFHRAFPMPIDESGLAGLVVRERRVFSTVDAQQDERLSAARRQAAAQSGFRSLVGVPMVRHGVVIGALNVARREARAYSAREIGLLETFADQAVIAIENVRLFTELREKNRALTATHARVSEALDQQTATSEILGVISRSPTEVGPVFDAVVVNAARLCEANDVALLLVDGADLRLAAGIGPLYMSIPSDFRLRLTRGSAATRAVIDRATIHIDDFAAEPEEEFPVGRELARRFGHRTMLAVPLLREGVPIGVICAFRLDVRPFPEQQRALLRTFADQAVIAIENVRLFTELQERNRQVTEALEQQTATSEILSVISNSPTNLQPVMDTVAQSAARLCGANDAQIFRVEGGTLRRVAQYGSLPTVDQIPMTRAWIASRAVIDRRIVHVLDRAAEVETEFPEGRESQRRIGHRTTLAIPLLREGAAIGAIFIARTEVRSFSDTQIELLRTFADQAVIAIENVRLFTELQEKNWALTEAHAQVMEALEQQTATSEILRTIAQAQTDAQPVFDTIVRSAAQLCRAANAAVFVRGGSMLYHPANYGSSPEALAAARAGFPRPVGMDTTAGVAILTRSVVHVPDSEDPAALEAVRQTGRALEFRSVVTVPMLREREAVGAILVARREPGRFSDGEVELLKTFADQAVIAIENVRLFKELEARTGALSRSVDQLTALGEVGRAVSSTLDLETVLTTIVARAVQLSGLDGGVVFEYDAAAEEFVQRVATESVAALAEARRTMRIRKGEGVLGRTAITLAPVQVPDITEPAAYEGRLRETLIASGIRAILAVPMVREGQLIGCLGVTRNRSGEFPAETIELLRTFATQSALAIQNARLFHEIEDKSRQLEAASRHKSEFLANMSHELRTPLNAIIGFSEVLSERMFGELNEKQAEYLKDIHASGQHLLSLINDILDLSKVEAGRMELELTDFDLPATLDNALALVRERAGRHGIALHLTVDDRVEHVRADERKIKQVILNLLSNAIKFTPDGGRIDVRAVPDDGGAAVSVSDTGVGIALEDQEAIFEEFRQVGTAAKKVEGTGLGLALSRKFVELHGGRIWVQSQVGIGSTFTFTIPMRRTDHVIE